MGEGGGDDAGRYAAAVGLAAATAWLFCWGDFEEGESLWGEGLAGCRELLPGVAGESASPFVEGRDLEDGALGELEVGPVQGE